MAIEIITERKGGHRVENIQALRGIAITLILMLHIGVYGYRLHITGPISDKVLHLLQAGVDLFFVISGFAMVMATNGNQGGPAEAAKFALRRAARIYPLYWAYTLAYLPVFLFVPTAMTRPEGLQGVSIFKSILLLPSRSSPLVGQGWTLILEIHFYLLVTLALLFREKWRAKIYAGIGVVTLLCQLAGESLAHAPSAIRIFSSLYTLDFLTGCAIGWMATRGINKHSFPALILGLLGLATAMLPHPDWNRVLVFILPVSLLTYGAVAVEARHKVRFPGWLRFLGDISYSLYLSQILTLSLLAKICQTTHCASYLIFACLAVACCIGVAAASYYWMEKPLLKVSYNGVKSFTRGSIMGAREPAMT